MMTKKHFEAIAAQLAAARPSNKDDVAFAQWERDIVAVSRACDAAVPGFNPNRFLVACLDGPVDKLRG